MLHAGLKLNVLSGQKPNFNLTILKLPLKINYFQKYAFSEVTILPLVFTHLPLNYQSGTLDILSWCNTLQQVAHVPQASL